MEIKAAQGGLLSGLLDTTLLLDFFKTDLEKDNIKGKVREIIEAEEEKNLDAIDLLEKSMLVESPMWFYKYNSDGFLMEFIQKYSDESFELKVNNEYNSHLQLVRQVTYDEIDEITDEVIYKYDSNGYVIEEENPFLEEKYIGIYNLSGQLIEIKKDCTTLKYEYDKDGFQTKTTEFNGNISLSTTILSYNTSKKVIEENTWKNGELTKSIKYEYDFNGNILQIMIKNKLRTSLYKYEYKYDNTSNWIERKFYSNENLKSITKRKIFYNK